MKGIVVVPVRKTRTMRRGCRLMGFNCWLSLSLITLFGLLTVCLEARAEERPILEAGGPGAATNLRSRIDCDDTKDRRGIAMLAWEVAEKSGMQQRVDLTIYHDGFEKGNFESSKVLSPKQASFEFREGLNTELAVRGPGRTSWRVLTLQSHGWVPSEVAHFSAPICVKDEGEERPVIK